MKKTKKRRTSRAEVITPLEGELKLDAYGAAWWSPFDGEPKKVEESESLCGVGFFSTGKDDPFIEACIVHDHTYVNRPFIEKNGWTREIVDDFFLVIMLNIAGDDPLLTAKAHAYYNVVRSVGWIFYYRH